MDELFVTDLDMEVARQLVQLSEGETTMTTTTATTTTSSSGSCNNNHLLYTTLDKIDGAQHRRVVLNNDYDDKVDNNKRKNRKKDVNNNNRIISLRLSTLGSDVAGELEDVDYRRKKNRRYRSIIELYNLTKPVNY